jgi:hypothetical protein
MKRIVESDNKKMVKHLQGPVLYRRECCAVPLRVPVLFVFFSERRPTFFMTCCAIIRESC